MKIAKLIPSILLILQLTEVVLAQAPLEPPAVIVYTDKPIYRPGNTITITVEALDEELQPAPGKSIIITVTDAGGNNVLDTAIRTKDDGVATISITLDPEAPEGEYLVEALDAENIFTPAVTFFIVCSACGIAIPEVKTTTLTTVETVTTTLIRTSIFQTTATVTEQVITKDTLLLAILAIIIALFGFQIMVIRRITKAPASTAGPR